MSTDESRSRALFEREDQGGVLGGGGLLPVYRLTEGVRARTIRRAIRGALDTLGEYPDYLDRATVETRNGMTIATMRVADELSLRRLAARRGGLVEVLEPAGARRAVAEWAEAGLAQYR